MNFFEEYEAEMLAKAQALTAAENAAWEALGPEGRAQAIADADARREAEDKRQERIAAQHVEMFGEDTDDPDDLYPDGPNAA
jgi:hypothetical protein